MRLFKNVYVLYSFRYELNILGQNKKAKITDAHPFL